MTRQFFKRSMTFLCSFVLVAALMFGSDVGLKQVKADDGGYTVTFCATGTHSVTVENGRIVVDGQIVELRDGNNVAIGTASMVGNEGRLTVADGTPGELNFGGQYFTLFNMDDHVALSAGSQISADMVIQIEDYEDPGQGGGGNNPPPPAAGVGEYNVNVTQSIPGFTGKMVIEFYDKADMDTPLQVREYSADASGEPIPAEANTVLIQFDPENVDNCLKYFKNGWYEITRDEQRYDFDVFDEIRENENHVFVLNSDCTIFTGASNYVQGMDIDPTTDSLNFRFEFDDTRNVSWSYDPSAPADQYVEHCRIYKLEGDDPTAIIDGTDFNLRIGEDFYFLLVPDYGYQVDGLMVNGWIPIQPMNGIGVFKFSMVDSNFHFNAMVSPTNDITDASGASAVSGVSIGNGENATEHGGNLRVTVTDADTPNGVSGVTDGTVLSTVDIGLENIVSKGTEDDYWSSQVEEFTNPIEVGLQLNPATTPDGTYSVVKEHKGVLTEIAADYDASTGMLTFPSNEFSTFTIVRTEDAKTSAEDNNSTSTTDTSSSSGSTATTETTITETTTTTNTLQSVANKPYETGKLYADNAKSMDTSMVHAGSGVTITGITEITNQAALSALAEEVNDQYQKTLKAGITCTKSFAMDLQATGSGSVTFDIGSTGPAAVIISHFHNGMWTRQIVDAVNGRATGKFNDFSPVYISVYEGVTAQQLRNAGIVENEFSAGSPKTGQDMMMEIIVAIMGCCAGFLVVRLRRKSR